MKMLISPADIERLARPCDANNDTANRAIEEAMFNDIAPRLGAPTFARVLDADEFSPLMDGGTYIDSCGNEQMFFGLKKALAYFAWGRIVKTSTLRVTRFGVVEKRGDNSSAIPFEERQNAYNDAFAIAQGYMEGVIGYIEANENLFPEFCSRSSKRAGGRVNIIGVEYEKNS